MTTVPHYLLNVDHPLIVPAGVKVRLLITGADVIHSWWVPAFGLKKDAIPGFINELWFNVDTDKTGALPRPVRRALRTRSWLHADRGRRTQQGRFQHLAEDDGGTSRSRPPPRCACGDTARGLNGEHHDHGLLAAHGAVAHDAHAAHDDHKPHGWRRWVYATNHKDIGTMYLVFAGIMFFVGGTLAMLIRLELFKPGLQFFDPLFFNSLTTMHALIMIFGAVMPAWTGLANWQIPDAGRRARHGAAASQ